VTGDPSTYLARARDVIRSVNSRVAVFDAKTLADRRDEVLGKPRFYTTATMFLGVLALLLAAAGIYGTALYSIAHRRREMGIRMALGASNGKLRATLLRNSLVPVAAGLICGVPAALASTRLILHLVSAAKGPDPLSVVGAGVILLAVAGIASWRAGAHLLSIDPLAAIRAE